MGGTLSETAVFFCLAMTGLQLGGPEMTAENLQQLDDISIFLRFSSNIQPQIRSTTFVFDFFFCVIFLVSFNGLFGDWEKGGTQTGTNNERRGATTVE